MDAAEYVKRMRQKNQLIMGIGHRVKSLSNPDMRVKIIKEYALKHFKNTKVLDFAMAVERVRRTTPCHTSQVSSCAGSVGVVEVKARFHYTSP